MTNHKYTNIPLSFFLKKGKNAEKKFELIESLKNLRGFLHELKAGL
jgi:hypothetical protein